MAENMGITGAHAAMGLATKVGKGGRGWAGRKAGRAATLPLRTEAGKKFTAGMQKFGQNMGFKNRFLDKTVGAAGRLATRPVREAGAGLAKGRLAVEKQVEYEKRKLPRDRRLKRGKNGVIKHSIRAMGRGKR